MIVQAFDKDLLRDQSLGAAVTDVEGRYDIRFDRDSFTGPLIRLERNPDIFLHVLDREGNRLASTESSIVVDAGKETNIDVEVAGALPLPGRFRVLDGQPVDLVAAAKLTTTDLVDGYRYLRGRLPQYERADLLREAFPGLFFKRRRRVDDCAEGEYAVLRRFTRERGSFALDTAIDADDFPAGVAVRSFFTENIVVKYTTDPAAGTDVVDGTLPAADAPVQLSDGTTMGFVRASLMDLHASNTEVAPIAVQQVGIIAEYALAQFLGPRFNVRDPRNGATRMEYRILDGSGAGGTNVAWSHVEVRPDNSLLQNIHTVAHEMFHQVQYRYNANGTATGFRSSILEGGARLVEDCINDASNRWADTAKGLLANPGLTLMDYPDGTKSSVNYESGLLWKYIAERHSTNTGAAAEPVIGFDAYRKILEACANVQPGDPGVGYGIAALRNARAGMPWYGAFDEFSWYSVAQGELSTNETTYGNFLVANYVHGLASPIGDARFDYKEDDDPITITTGIPDDELRDFQANVDVNNSLSLTQNADIPRNAALQPYSAVYYRLTPSGSPRMLRVTFTASAALTDPLVQILRLNGSSIVDLHRSDRTSWTKTVNVAGTTSIAVIVAARTAPGNFDIRFEEIPSASDVMATRWNSAAGTEYEANPQGWSWTWVSPDVMVDTNDDLLRDTDVFFGVNNKLKLRLRNRGNAAANGVTVQFYYQKAAPGLNPASWIPVTNAASVTQTVGPINLAANSDQWVSVDWAPVDDGSHAPHWCVKAVINAPGDPNTDNKVVLSNFGHVIEAPDMDLLQLIRTSTETALDRIHLIARGPRFVLTPKVWRGELNAKQAALCACGSATERLRDGVAFGKLALETRALQQWSGAPEREPSEQHYYPIDPRTLPPGTVAENLVTIAHVEDGAVAGGVTYEIVRK